MTTPTHCCIGYLIAQGALAVGILDPSTAPIATTVCMFAANAPDVDTLDVRCFLKHRNSPFHVPLYWFIAWIGAYTGALMINESLFTSMVILAGINIFLHFITDSIGVGYGIKWLAPFNDRQFGLIVGKPAHTFRSYVQDNIRRPLILVEVPFWILTWYIYYFT